MQNSWSDTVGVMVQTLHLAEFIGVMTEEARPLCWTSRAINSAAVVRVIAATASPSVATRQPRLPTLIRIDTCSECGEEEDLLETSSSPSVPYTNLQICETCFTELY